MPGSAWARLAANCEYPKNAMNAAGKSQLFHDCCGGLGSVGGSEVRGGASGVAMCCRSVARVQSGRSQSRARPNKAVLCFSPGSKPSGRVHERHTLSGEMLTRNRLRVAGKGHDRLPGKALGDSLENLLCELGSHEGVHPNVRAVDETPLARAMNAPAVRLGFGVAAHAELSKLARDAVAELE